MTAQAPPRPGPVLGVYPQRETPDPGALEAFLERVLAAFKQAWPPSARRWRGPVRAILARESALAALDRESLDAAVLAVRQRLRIEGLEPAPCIEAFALVREMAHRVLGMRPFEVQLLGAWAMLQGKLAEMQTGEGKTLTATLTAATAALAGIPVHILTVNDYLVARDAQTMGPLYSALGLKVGAVLEGMDQASKRAAYRCDICYCTNKQLVFDYLRDRLVQGSAGPMRLRLDGLYGSQSLGERLLLRGLCFAILDEADSILVDEARTPLVISRGGDAAGQQGRYEQALELAGALKGGLDYRLDQARREVELTDAGRERLAGLAAGLAGADWQSARRREELVTQALHASHLLARDRHYLVKDGKVQIVDEYTGRLMPDRSWERGLHQLVETREGCDPTPVAETVARIGYQRFFRRYLRLAGMTGTAREVTGELWLAYRLDAVAIPTHRPLRRRRRPALVFRRAADKWQAAVGLVAQLHRQGRPVLVGTASVGASERLGALLAQAGIPHRVLNARQDRDEAEVVAAAGRLGAVTVATNMAGRGTDIGLGPGVAELGGLFVLATERHEAGRIDRQLYGRCARQGDPGEHQCLVSLEDDLVAQGGWTRLAVGWLPGAWVVGLAQRAAERRHARVRHRLLRLDLQVGRMLAFSGRME
jgi:preprotein translocase subunit SecA